MLNTIIAFLITIIILLSIILYYNIKENKKLKAKYKQLANSNDLHVIHLSKV